MNFWNYIFLNLPWEKKNNPWNLSVDTLTFKCISLSAKSNFCCVSSITQTLNSYKGKSSYKADWSVNLADQCNNPFAQARKAEYSNLQQLPKSVI